MTAIHSKFQEWLDRKKKGKAVPKPIPKVSPKRKIINKEYDKRKDLFLRAHPFCQIYMQVYGIHESVVQKNNGWAVITNAIGNVRHHQVPEATQIHHTKGRGKYMLDESTWMAASFEWHRWAHDHPDACYPLGILVKRVH